MIDGRLEVRLIDADSNMATLGRLMQIVGLVVPPLAMILQWQGAITLGQMLTFLVAAVSAFWIGRIIEGYSIRS